MQTFAPFRLRQVLLQLEDESLPEPLRKEAAQYLSREILGLQYNYERPTKLSGAGQI